MRQFTPKSGTRSMVHVLKTPLPDIDAFTGVARSLVLKNPLGCTSYYAAKRHHPPVAVVRERYTAKFVYADGTGRQIGSSSDVYDSVEGYREGIHAVMANMANTAAHRGKPRHVPGADRFSAIFQCHDPGGELYIIGLARDRVTVASFTGNAIQQRAEAWVDADPLLG